MLHVTEDPPPKLGNDPEEIVHAADLLRLLGDPTRLGIMALLADQELSVATIAAALNRPVPAVSQHLAKLRSGHLVCTRREGRTIFYRHADDHLSSLVDNILVHAAHSLEDGPH